ncbi:MAG TPA: SpoIIIAH-like family protein [Bacillales bacterium]|nr:SpoIIIAH-like family protein [Bacillales bacterium]
MMLKKQTVWLLTMLSLIIVLSVYYMTSPPANQLAVTGTQEDQKEDKKTEKQKEKPKSEESTTNDEAAATNSGEEVKTTAVGKAAFASARLKRMQAREELQEQYTAVITSEKATAEEIAQAREKLTALNQMSSKEKMLESLIVAGGYGEDALVNVQNDKIKIYVQAGDLSNKQAAKIIGLVEGKVNMSTHNIFVTFKAPNQ